VAEEVAKSGNLNISNGALVVLDPKSGENFGICWIDRLFLRMFGVLRR